MAIAPAPNPTIQYLTHDPDAAGTPGEHIGQQPLTTREGWARYVDHQPGPPSPQADSEERIDYLSDLVMVNTPTVTEAITTARRLVLLNRRQISARRGLLLTGMPGTGKTTAITAVGRTHELATRRRHPDQPWRIPVFYITVPPAATPRMLAVEFARFLGLPLPHRPNLTDIVEAVCTTAPQVGVELVLVDEIHNLNLATRAGAEVSDQLKYFAERLPATFIYAGIDAEHAGLFTGPRGRQLATRFTTIPTSNFPHTTDPQRQTWQALVTALETTLPLRRHPAGTLTRHAEYLHRRTAGLIGSLSHLLRSAAIDAILDGSEHIAESHLNAIRLDHAAQTQPPASNNNRATPTPAAIPSVA